MKYVSTRNKNVFLSASDAIARLGVTPLHRVTWHLT